MFIRRSPAVSALLTLVALGGFAAPLYADNPSGLARIDELHEFNIPSGSLETALMAFGREMKMQLIVDPQVRDSSVPAVRGRLTGRKALDVLLRASGLGFTLVGNTVTICAPRAKDLRCSGPSVAHN